ncbi:uncharacterized protein BYT42DRAFT_633370 [Radiomyces spectabilis]|uniref:uncharacterized protein n=1 Tax=Radiomyces spectabilis TaxID=64574 RepID=UPI00221E8BA5|nr:uncharacterized protein BYT42DRAFT_633370 [Radiomyces spectabilis]KAI8384766.1 hypothetical protein BYT42DRAFT_633370 [Radiomyces spectabilis]
MPLDLLDYPSKPQTPRIRSKTQRKANGFHEKFIDHLYQARFEQRLLQSTVRNRDSYRPTRGQHRRSFRGSYARPPFYGARGRGGYSHGQPRDNQFATYNNTGQSKTDYGNNNQQLPNNEDYDISSHRSNREFASPDFYHNRRNYQTLMAVVSDNERLLSSVYKESNTMEDESCESIDQESTRD